MAIALARPINGDAQLFGSLWFISHGVPLRYVA
jgi:hypothetical protein